MTPDFPTLPTGPLPHLAMDYARLRAEGLRLLGRLTGAQWTDFNTHDPGITILEQLCFAITELGYRSNFPVADLIAASPHPGLPGPAEILTGDPVTRADLRALVLDLAATENAWVGPPPRRTLDLHYHEGSKQLRLGIDTSELGSPTVEPRGVLRVAVQTHDEFSGDAALDLVSQQLHASRLLGQDFEVDWLESVDINIRASIEVAALDDPVATLADIIEQIEDTLAPAARFISLAQARARGSQLDQILEGPRLEHGVVEPPCFGHSPPLAVPSASAPESVFASDLIHAITNVAQVRAVRSISPSLFEIPAGKVARLGANSELILQRAGLVIQADITRARQLAAQRRRARKRSDPSAPGVLDPAPGRERSLARYHSIQRQLPAAYGIGPLGLPGSADAHRRAQARQLEAYLLIFDQLLANEFAQLAHAHELLSPDEGGVRTYFTQPVDDPPMSLPSLLGATPDTATPEALSGWLEQQVESDGLERRKRFLAHLLARFAEQLGDYSVVREGASEELDADLVAKRQSFLRRYPRLSGARGSGHGLRDDSVAGVVERLQAKLGLPDLRFELVEHILLRPIDEDRNQLDPSGEAPVPLLANVAIPDPWSLQVSVVFEQPDISGRQAWFESLQVFVAQTLLAELPAHLRVHVHWLDQQGDSNWAAFADAWAQLRGKLRSHRWPGAETDHELAQLQLRDARDRVIDLLGLGRSFPLRDVPWPHSAVVAPGTATTITLGFSQLGVEYELRDANDQPVLLDGQPIKGEGTGAELVLETPPINVDVTYRILATKLELIDPLPEGEPPPGLPEPRWAWLHGAIEIKEGVDPALIIEIIELPLLDDRIDSPKPTDARIADYGATVQVAIYESQEGVEYELCDHAKLDRVLSASVIGTSGTIVLTLEHAYEDVDLRVRGSKSVGDPQHPELREAELNLVLPLRVRANPALTTQLAAALVDYGGDAMVELLGAQSSASYQLWQRPIADSEFLFDPPVQTPRIQVTGEAGHVIEVLRPPHGAIWADVPGFTAVADPVPGTGAKLSLPIASNTDDTCLLIQAGKQHRKASAAVQNDELIGSAIQLEAALALLVRPDPERMLRLSVNIVEKDCVGPWRLHDGQPGVYYQLHTDAPVALPGYFHKQAKGIDELRLEIDLAIARDGDGDGDIDPELEVEPLPIDTELHVLARKAMAGLSAKLVRSALLSGVPPLVLKPEQVSAGKQAMLLVEQSSERDRYTVLRAGEPLDKPRNGNGATLEIDLGQIDETTEFVLAVENLDYVKQGNLPVERRVTFTVEVS
jgi:hypothetical protein